MFGTIRKHQSWLWAIIIGITIVSFVVFWSPYSKVSDSFGRRRVNLGTINGQPVTQEDYLSALRDVKLQYFLRRRAWPDRDPAAKQTGFNEEREVYDRLLLLQKIDALQIRVSDNAVVQYGSDILRDLGGQSGPIPLKVFEEKVLAEGGMTAGDFEQLLRHDLELQQLVSIIAMTGTLLTPQEAQTLYQYEHEQVIAQVVVFRATNYVASVVPTPIALEQYFTNHITDYRIPEKVEVSYVRFDLTNYWSAGALMLTNSITNLNEAIDQAYQRFGSNYNAKTPEEGKQLMVHDEISKTAMMIANSNAVVLTDEVISKEPARADYLTEVAKKWSLPVKVTAPFDLEHAPTELDIPAAWTRVAFSLTPEEPVAPRPLVGTNGVYVVALRTNLPSHDTSFESVRDRVEQDYKTLEATRLAREAGEGFYWGITNGLSQGKSFTNLCQELKAKAIQLPAFSRADQTIPALEEPIPFGHIKEEAFRVRVGHASDTFIPTADGGFVIFVQSHPPLDEAKMKQELPQFTMGLRQSLESESFRRWFADQERIGLRDTPLARRATAPTGAVAE